MNIDAIEAKRGEKTKGGFVLLRAGRCIKEPIHKVAPTTFKVATHSKKKRISLSQFTKNGSLQDTPATKKG